MEQTTDCIFCKIARKEADSTILHESDNIMIIRDIMPKAPVHVQVMPKKHINSVNELIEDDAKIISEMFMAARDYAAQVGIASTGYKLVINSGKEGGQVLHHLSMHMLGGKQLEE